MEAGYIWVLLLAMAPFVEIFFAIPAGVAMGLDVLLVAMVAFVGNFLPLPLLALLHERLAQRFPRLFGASATGARRRRGERARNLLVRWGVPGLALQAPVGTGSHFATPLALTMGADQRHTLIWMALALVLWSVAIALVSVLGMEGIQRLMGAGG